MELEMRPVAPDEVEEWMRAFYRAFGGQLEEARLQYLRSIVVPDRSLAVFDGGEIVAEAHSKPYAMTVPGGSLATAGVDFVSVISTHRRRGLLTRMMAHQLADVHERGAPLAALWASESVIYGRFGYGIGSFHERWTIDRQHTAFARPHDQSGRVAFVEPDEMKRTFPDVYQRATVNRPGAIERPEPAWNNLIADLESDRRGASALLSIVYEQNGRVDGYVMYRTKGERLIVTELMAVTPEAHARLWRFCFDVDLRTSTEAYNRPVDDPLLWMLADPRRLQRSPGDALWVRLVDARAALSGRRYMQSDQLVLEVHDSFCPWNEGRYELEGGPHGAECRPSTANPNLALSAADLAAAYLGAVSFTTLARAGRVEERTSDALRRADNMFATQLRSWCPYSF